MEGDFEVDLSELDGWDDYPNNGTNYYSTSGVIRRWFTVGNVDYVIKFSFTVDYERWYKNSTFENPEEDKVGGIEFSVSVIDVFIYSISGKRVPEFRLHDSTYDIFKKELEEKLYFY